MQGINKVIIVGCLGANPEHRQFDDGGRISSISIATSKKWRDKESGEQRESTEWHRVVLFNSQADIAAKYLTKGSKVYIEGKLRTRRYQDSTGMDRYITEIHTKKMLMLGSPANRSIGTTTTVPVDSFGNGYDQIIQNQY